MKDGPSHLVTQSPSHDSSKLTPTAVLLTNYGGPERAEDCEPYLRNIFLDPDLIPVPGFLRPFAASMIARRRAPKLIENYRAMGRYSPILGQTRAQAEALQAELGEGYRVFVGMSYWKPFIREACEEIARGGFERVVLLPLYPQESRATTGSCLKEARRRLAALGYVPLLSSRGLHAEGSIAYPEASCEGPRRRGSDPAGQLPPDSRRDCHGPSGLAMTGETGVLKTFAEIRSFWDEEGFLSALGQGVREALDRAPEGTRVLFCAHGLPLSLAKKDPYPGQVLATVAALCTSLNLALTPIAVPGSSPAVPARNSELGTRNFPAALAWQSRVGPMRWLEPSVETVLEEWAREGVAHAVLVPVAFVSEHSETLYELDVLYAGRAKALGMTVTRVPTVQTHPHFIAALARLVRASSDSPSLSSSPAPHLSSSPQQRHPEDPQNGPP